MTAAGDNAGVADASAQQRPGEEIHGTAQHGADYVGREPRYDVNLNLNKRPAFVSIAVNQSHVR